MIELFSMALHVKQLAVGGFDKNFSYLIYENISMAAMYVDPTGSTEKVFDYVRREALTITGILITHTHFDHIDQLAVVHQRSPVPIYVHQNGRGRIPEASVLLGDGDIVRVGEAEMTVLHTPGHLEDSICLYSADTRGASVVITGDTLFVGGCGRTTESMVRDLYDSLQTLKALPPETVVYPGHDYGETPVSTIGAELAHNRFLRAADFPAFKTLRLGA